MRKTIAGSRYDTETARLVAEYHTESIHSDPARYEELLYRTNAGKYFIYGAGGPESKYAATGPDGSSINGERITPVSEQTALQFVKDHCEPAIASLILSELSPEVHPLTARISPKAKAELEQVRAASNLTTDQIVNRALVLYAEHYFASQPSIMDQALSFGGWIEIVDQSKTYQAQDGHSAAVAETGHCRDRRSCYVRTSGGMYYPAPDFAAACAIAENLVSAWDRGDYDYKP